MGQDKSSLSIRLTTSIESRISPKQSYALGPLVKEVSLAENVPESEVTKAVYTLLQDKKIKMTEPEQRSPLVVRFFSFENLKFLALLLVPVLAVVAVLGPDAIALVVDVRYVVGGLLVILLPGYGITVSLYPRKELGSLQKAVYSVAISLVFVLFIGVILDNSPWGLTVDSVVTSFVAADTALLAFASLRKLGSSGVG
jgi:uncharacterized membrane protein